MKTAQRQSIFNYLKNNTSHPTAKEIYSDVSRQNNAISLATVYNTLSLMKKKALIRELAIINSDEKRYDANVSPHAHLICTNCHKIADINYLIHVGIPDEHRQGFAIKNSEIKFYGLCPACNKNDTITSE